MALKDPEGIFEKLYKTKFMQETTTTRIFTSKEMQ
jgi:hypothetical protein